MSTENTIHQIGVTDAVQYWQAYSKCKHPVRPNSLAVLREFDAMYPGVSGYHVQALRGLPAVLAITDPGFATETAREKDFKSLTQTTRIGNGLEATRGNFIFRPSDKFQWQQDRKVMSVSYGSSPIEEYKSGIAAVADFAVERYFARHGKNLPPEWLKCVALDQLSLHVVGRLMDEKLIDEAARELARFVRHTSLVALLGFVPESSRSEIGLRMLPKFRSLLNQMYETHIESPKSGMLGRMIDRYPERESDARDMLGTMVSGLSFIPTQLSFTMWNLAKNFDMQMHARQDSDYLWKCMWATNLMYPAVPYTGRTVTNSTEVEGIKMEKGSMVIMVNAAYGGKKYIERAEVFDPDRPNLEKMAKKTEGNANIFGNGLHMCPAVHFAPSVCHSTLQSILNRWQLGVSNNEPINAVLGGVSMRTQKPIPLVLEELNNSRQSIKADIAW